MYYFNGDQYDGEWKQDKRHGTGIYRFKGGASYEGEWMNDKKHGKGRFDWGDGSTYEGQWKEDHQHGKGTFRYANGDVYVGQFANDLQNGKGIYRNAELGLEKPLALFGDIEPGIFLCNEPSREGDTGYEYGRSDMRVKPVALRGVNVEAPVGGKMYSRAFGETVPTGKKEHKAPQNDEFGKRGKRKVHGQQCFFTHR